jgi:hypothetical protein
MDWGKAKRDAARAVAALPEYTGADIEREYTALLAALAEPDVKAMATPAKTFAMYQRFPMFANSYSGMFNMACRRAEPVPMSVIKQMLDTIEMQKLGVISEAKAHGRAMDLAESFRRERDSGEWKR